MGRGCERFGVDGGIGGVALGEQSAHRFRFGGIECAGGEKPNLFVSLVSSHGFFPSNVRSESRNRMRPRRI